MLGAAQPLTPFYHLPGGHQACIRVSRPTPGPLHHLDTDDACQMLLKSTSIADADHRFFDPTRNGERQYFLAQVWDFKVNVDSGRSYHDGHDDGRAPHQLRCYGQSCGAGTHMMFNF